MGQFRELLPRPRSKFLQVKCPRCGNTQLVFSHSSLMVECRVCKELLVQPKGGKAIIKGEVLTELE